MWTHYYHPESGSRRPPWLSKLLENLFAQYYFLLCQFGAAEALLVIRKRESEVLCSLDNLIEAASHSGGGLLYKQPYKTNRFTLPMQPPCVLPYLIQPEAAAHFAEGCQALAPYQLKPQGKLHLVKVKPVVVTTPGNSSITQGPLWAFWVDADPRIFHLTASLWQDAGVARISMERSDLYETGAFSSIYNFGQVHLTSDGLLYVARVLQTAFGNYHDLYWNMKLFWTSWLRVCTQRVFNLEKRLDMRNCVAVEVFAQKQPLVSTDATSDIQIRQALSGFTPSLQVPQPVTCTVC